MTIKGGTVASPTPKPDWNQNDSTKADYIKNKPNPLLKSGGTMTGEINMGSKKITNLATPTADADASNKKYVDDGLEKKQNTITGAITPVLTSNFVTGRVIVSDSNGKLSANAITTDELSKLDGVTANIQAQLDEKAPSGYGLGTAAPYNSNVDNLYVGGFYRWDTDNSQTPFANGTMVVLPRNDGVRASQLAICNSGTGTGVIAVRSTKTDAVGEWLYLNPVMYPGTEYLTSEFWNNGKPVYKKLVSMGKLTTEFVTVAHGASLYYVVGVEAMAINESTKVSFPIAYSANDNVDDIGVYVDTTNVTIHNPGLLSAYSGWVTIKYVK